MDVLVQSISIFIIMFMGIVAWVDRNINSILFTGWRVKDVTLLHYVPYIKDEKLKVQYFLGCLPPNF